MDLNITMNQVYKEIQDIGIPCKQIKGIKWTNARQQWGACWEKNGTYNITISNMLKQEGVPEKAVKSVIAHEIIHTCEGCWNHGEKFRKYCSIVKEKYGYNPIGTKPSGGHKPEDLGIDEEKVYGDQMFKYIIQCADCGKKWKYNRRQQWFSRLEKCRCPYCKDNTLKFVKGTI